jgi:hypothetical protein
MKTWICEFDSGEVRICSHFNCHGQEPRNELLPVAHKLVVNALQARPQLEDIEVWIGLERTSKYTRSLGSVLLRDDLLTSLYGRRPRKLVLYLYKDRLIIFRQRGTSLVVQLDTYPNDLLLVTYNLAPNNSALVTIFLERERGLEETNPIVFARILFDDLEKAQVWSAFLTNTLLPSSTTTMMCQSMMERVSKSEEVTVGDMVSPNSDSASGPVFPRITGNGSAERFFESNLQSSRGTGVDDSTPTYGNRSPTLQEISEDEAAVSVFRLRMEKIKSLVPILDGRIEPIRFCLFNKIRIGIVHHPEIIDSKGEILDLWLDMQVSSGAGQVLTLIFLSYLMVRFL